MNWMAIMLLCTLRFQTVIESMASSSTGRRLWGIATPFVFQKYRLIPGDFGVDSLQDNQYGLEGVFLLSFLVSYLPR